MTDGDLPTLGEAVATLARAAASGAGGEPPELTAGRIEEQVRSLRPDGRPRLGLELGDRREFVAAPFEAGALVAMGRGIGEPLEGRRFVRFADAVACTWTSGGPPSWARSFVVAVRSVRPGEADPTVDGMVAASGDSWVGDVAARAVEAESGGDEEAIAPWLAVARDVVAAETRLPIIWIRTEFPFGSVKMASTMIRRAPWRGATDEVTPAVGQTTGADEAVLALAASLVPTEARWKRTGDGPDRLGSSWSRRGRVGGVWAEASSGSTTVDAARREAARGRLRRWLDAHDAVGTASALAREAWWPG